MSAGLPGGAVIEAMIGKRRLQRVTADAELVAGLLVAAGRHLESAGLAAPNDPDGAYSLAYDAARKSATAVLAQQGLRPTSSGGHVVVAEAMRAQFPGAAGLNSLDRLRRRRNQAEYPQPNAPAAVTADEVADVLSVAGACLASARALVDQGSLGPFP